MANRLLYDLLPRNLEFHNFSYCQLTNVQSRVMGLGLKFKPTLKPPTVLKLTEEIKDFTRSVRLHHRFGDTPGDPSATPKLYVKSDWDPLREDFELENNLHLLKKELQQNILIGIRHWKSNLSKEEKSEIDKIKINDSVRVLGTDKNLGPALLATDWVKTQTFTHLNDTSSYRVVTQRDWVVNRNKVIEYRERLIDIYKHHIDHIDDNSEVKNLPNST